MVLTEKNNDLNEIMWAGLFCILEDV